MNTQKLTDIWNGAKTKFCDTINCVKGKYAAYKASDYKQLRRKYNVEYSVCTKSAPDTPITNSVVTGDVMVSFVDLALIAGAALCVCHLLKVIHCRCCR